MGTLTSAEPPILALVQALGDAPDLTAALEARGWIITHSSDQEQTAALLASADFHILVIVDNAETGLDLIQLAASRGLVCMRITSSGEDRRVEGLDYSFTWSPDDVSNNNDLDQCERLVALKTELARAKARTRLFIEAGHQLKSPVAVMKEFTQLLKSGIGGELSQKQGQYVQVIDDNINRLLVLLENVEALGSLDFNGWPVNLENLDCPEIIEKVAASWAVLVESKGLELRVSPSKTRVSARADMSAVDQILFNLIDNASKYCSPNGTITLACKSTTGHAILSVANDGKPIPADSHETIFDPFHRLPDHAAAPGLGLGLTIARKLAATMEAELYLDTKFNGGARFILAIPLV